MASAFRVYATGFGAFGDPMSGWDATGHVTSDLGIPQRKPAIVSEDGLTTVAWVEHRTLVGTIGVQRLDSRGEIVWARSGVPLCPGGECIQPQIVSDGVGGVFVAWQRETANGRWQVKLTHLSPDGSVSGAWSDSGVTVAEDSATVVFILSRDRARGAYVVWVQPSDGSIRCTRMADGGSPAPGWSNEGLVVCDRPGLKTLGAIVLTMRGDAMVVWEDQRADAGDIYLMAIRESGSIAEGFPDDGLVLCAAGGVQMAPRACSDGFDGVFVAWTDVRDGTYRVYMTHALRDGEVPEIWPVDGRPIAQRDLQSGAHLVPDGAGGAIAVWRDQTASPGGVYSIVGMRIHSSGLNDPTWGDRGSVIREAPGLIINMVAVPDGTSGAYCGWSEYDSGSRMLYPYIQRVDGSGIAGPPPPSSDFVVEPAFPNPTADATRLSFTARREANVTVELFDIGGRKVRQLMHSQRVAPGSHSVNWIGDTDDGRRAGPGLYLAMLRFGSYSQAVRIVLLR